MNTLNYNCAQLGRHSDNDPREHVSCMAQAERKQSPIPHELTVQQQRGKTRPDSAFMGSIAVPDYGKTLVVGDTS